MILTRRQVNQLMLAATGLAEGDKSNMASAGIGSASHLAGVALQAATGFQSLHVPYKGAARVWPRWFPARPIGC